MREEELGREFRGGTILGGPTAERGDGVIITSYDQSWPTLFAEMRDRLAATLGDTAERIDHIGSTAVPGLPAKPVVDIQISVPDVEDEDAYRGPVEQLGFALRYREPGHRYFRPPPGRPRLWQVHVCAVGSRWERDHLLFRDYLRAHSAAVAEYADLKRQLAREHPTDRIAYTDSKGSWILATLASAEQWARATDWQP